MQREKQLASADDLRLLVQNAVNASPEVRQHNEELVVHDPFWHEADHAGCNWSISGYMGLSEYADDFRSALQNVRSNYNLKS
jgi:hypothetical protein